jgi:hypothetical protein
MVGPDGPREDDLVVGSPRSTRPTVASTIVFPLPIDVIRPFLEGPGSAGPGEPSEALPAAERLLERR